MNDASGVTSRPASAPAPWYQFSSDEVAERLQVDPARGLTAAEAQQRLQKYGPNALAAAKAEPVWKRFFKHYRDYMQIVLVVAAMVSLLIGEYGDRHRARAADPVQRLAGLPPGGQGRGGRRVTGAR